MVIYKVIYAIVVAEVLLSMIVVQIMVVDSSMVQAPLWHIESSYQSSTFRSEGFVISQVQADWEVLTGNECECRMLCWSRQDCGGFSVHLHDGRKLCRATMEGPHNLILEENAEGTYTYWQKAVPWKAYLFKHDGFLYLIPDLEKNFPDSKAFCASIPGHRLAILHNSTQMAIATSMAKREGVELWLDLHTGMDGVFWGDGEPLDTSAALKVVGEILAGTTPSPVRIRQAEDGGPVFDDNSATNVRHFLCHANPDGLEW